MNNLNLKNMKKVSVFRGVVNGKEFNNVVDYNAELKALMDAGETDIQASSSTSIKTVTDESSTDFVTTSTADQCPGTCTEASIELPEDEDLSIYPYMEDDDPFYLDILVTSDRNTNSEAYTEVGKRFEKCIKFIVEILNDKNTCNCDRKEFFDNVTEILDDLKDNMTSTKAALDKIIADRKKIDEEFNEYKRRYDAAMEESYRDEELLVAAKKMIKKFDDFYKTAQNEALVSIKTHANDNCDCNDDVVETTCIEKTPTSVHDFNALMNRIFGSTGLF